MWYKLPFYSNCGVFNNKKDINGETKASTFALENSFNHPATKDARSLYLKMPGRPTGRIPSGDILKGMKSLET